MYSADGRTNSTPRRRGRVGRDIPGAAHFLTFSCAARRPLLSDTVTIAFLVRAINAATAKHHAALWAFVFMPEHVHLLVKPHRLDFDISRLLADIKRPVSVKTRRRLEAIHDTRTLNGLSVDREGTRCFRFWLPGGGYDRVLTEPREIQPVVEYIHHNPVRRGLTTDPRSWPWSSAAPPHPNPDLRVNVDPIQM